MRIATIIARRELARARTLAGSLARHTPHAELTAFVLDPLPGEASQEEPFELLSAEQLALDEFSVLAGRLTLPELREAVKPLLVRGLLERDPARALLYLDADSYVIASIAELEPLADEHGLLIWPRTTSPPPADGRRPNEADLRGWGLFDPGALAFGAGHRHDELLSWWERHSPAGDQRAEDENPVDRFTMIAGSHFEVRDIALGASFWNLDHHSLTASDEGLLIDGAPLRLLRLIDFDPAKPQELSDKQDRIRVADQTALAALLHSYADELRENGDSSAAEPAYAWDVLPDGTRLDQRLRDIYTRAVTEADLPRSIFTPVGLEEFYAWLAEPAPEGAAFAINRLCWLVREAQPQLREGYPDLDDRDQASGYIGWLHAYGVEPGTLPLELVPPLSDRQRIEQRARAPVMPWGVNVAGYFRSGSSALGRRRASPSRRSTQPRFRCCRFTGAAPRRAARSTSSARCR